MYRMLQVSSTELGQLSLVLPDVIRLSGKDGDDHMFLEQVLIEAWDEKSTNIHFYPSAGGMSRRATLLLLGPNVYERIVRGPLEWMFHNREVEVDDTEYGRILEAIAVDTGNWVPAVAN